MSQPLWLEMTEIIALTIAGAVLVFYAILAPVFSSTGAFDFGLSCTFSFYEYGLVNSVLSPSSAIASEFLHTPVMSIVPASTVQSSCLQSSNINVNTLSGLGTQIYSKASSCFGLLSGNDYTTGQGVLKSKGENFIFSCYNGRVLTTDRSGSISNFSALISYIDKNYYNPADPLQIAIITNGSDGNSKFPYISQNVTNGSYYSIAMLGFPGSSLPGDCYSDSRADASTCPARSTGLSSRACRAGACIPSRTIRRSSTRSPHRLRAPR